ncbi:hypothetical protein MCUN1_001652 [Malassezia cuniculi]|uniref:ABC transporter domain-containing protein n=1 Tax=Malassezia cuniculi TaxID=948313 RepID=A0AAF0EY84_9BASI|nr:hypothetical protein MCUN1_001652 [Malassezia cuniculi]
MSRDQDVRDGVSAPIRDMSQLGEIPLVPLTDQESREARFKRNSRRHLRAESEDDTKAYGDIRAVRASRAISIDTLDPKGVRELSNRLSQEPDMGNNSMSNLAHRSNSDGHEKDDVGTSDPFDTNARFDLGRLLQEVFAESDARGNERRAMGLAFRDLMVTGFGSGVKLNETVLSSLLGPFRLLGSLRSILHPPVKVILQDVQGCVKPGEMLLVLGRPGAGCTSFLKALASYRDGFRSIEGTVLYEGLDHKAIDGPLRGDVVYSPEDDIHFPSMTVGDTLKFATATRAPNAKYRVTLGERQDRREYVDLAREILATVLGLRHTYNTKVGNDYIRGVSGGERKRVSIAEALASRAKVLLFDNSSRGLDASTALEFVTALRISTNICRTATIASIYQAGENITQLFDKVMVLNQGRLVYFGPLAYATAYFKSIGYLPQDRQTTADFLVACTDENGRRIRPGYEATVPRTPDEQARAFRESQIGRANRAEVDNYISTVLMHQNKPNANKYIGLARDERAKHTPRGGKFLLSWPMQVRLAVRRRALIAWGDLGTHLTVIFAALFQALIIGSVFYDLKDNTSGFFSRAGVLFFSLLYNSFTAMSEISLGYEQRPIIIRQKRFAMLLPSADALGNTILDFPIRMISLLIFDIIVYFMTGLSMHAGKFFTYLGVTCLVTYTMVAFFRMVAAATRSESIATLWGGVAVIDVALYTGYMIPRSSMRVWWKWLSYCQPVAFGFEILLSNEFRGSRFRCQNMVPSGEGYENVQPANQVCPVLGAQPGDEYVHGPTYLDQMYGFRWDHTSRNAVIVLAFWAVFILTYLFVSERQIDPAASGGVMLYNRASASKAIVEEAHRTDEEAIGHEQIAEQIEAIDQEHEISGHPHPAHLKVSESVFSWHNITYDVMIKGNPRRLLDFVSGYVAPGKMTALMGESGAGKTTLLNVLAQRTNMGVVRGDFFVNGKPLPKSFQADTGYCQQQDVHLAQQTVREALQFSAMLRQPRETPPAERLAYVETVIELLEMQSFAEAIVGEVGEGLNVEQRKRLTIGVELAAKPSLLLFLDEPTSGLDAQAAWSIIKFLKKLANNGQAILCTIHQPSGELFNQFDRLLLLQKGGKTVYFGDIGQNSMTLINYFEQRSGMKCGENDNPAEYILEVIGAGATATTDKDWHQLFKESELNTQLHQDLKKLMVARPDHVDEDMTARAAREYAQPYMVQFKEVMKRCWISYWRNPVYVLTKLVINLVSGLVVGSSFWAQGSIQTKIALQNRLFACFMALVSSTTLSQHLQPEFIRLRSLYEVREKPSKMYAWPIMVLSAMLIEIPWNFVGGTLYWLPWYWMIQFPADPQRSGYSWGLYMIFQMYYSTFAQAMAAIAPNAVIASVLFSTFFSFVVVFCGVVQPPDQLPEFWSKWMFYLSPFTWVMEGILGNAIGGVEVKCAIDEMQEIVPPTGQSCQQYMGSFKRGYTVEHEGKCLYCLYKYGDDYLGDNKLDATDRYRDLGIMFAYIAFNIALLFTLFYLFRIHKWSSNKKQEALLADPNAAVKEEPDSELPPPPGVQDPTRRELGSPLSLNFGSSAAMHGTPKTDSMTPLLDQSASFTHEPFARSESHALLQGHPSPYRKFDEDLSGEDSSINFHSPVQLQPAPRAHPLREEYPSDTMRGDRSSSPYMFQPEQYYSQRYRGDLNQFYQHVETSPRSEVPQQRAYSRRHSRQASRSRSTAGQGAGNRQSTRSANTMSGMSYYYDDTSEPRAL